MTQFLDKDGLKTTLSHIKTYSADHYLPLSGGTFNETCGIVSYIKVQDSALSTEGVVEGHNGHKTEISYGYISVTTTSTSTSIIKEIYNTTAYGNAINIRPISPGPIL